MMFYCHTIMIFSVVYMTGYLLDALGGLYVLAVVFDQFALFVAFYR